MTPNVKLYENDNTNLSRSNPTLEFFMSQVTNFRDPEIFVEITFQKLCEKQCMQPDCQSILHVVNNILYESSPWTSEIHIRHSMNPVTGTVTQAAVPLISFLTSLCSTFGFWMGLSVMGSLSYIKRARDTNVFRWRSLIWNEDGTSRLRRLIPKRKRMTETIRRTVRLFHRIHPRTNNEENTTCQSVEVLGHSSVSLDLHHE